ncbi:hypothetical protein FY528_05310 [Hymenobacter lutimineralis]|uniref:Uncharacterized protein n=1 Tax=Hymenobacter lutimineralis TaxID=2606448 RepID=A0A5D6VCY4_9BACT|nr:hypothetical protein [Hymenobacter lutimineralis]TYZ12709.1 hypothetical protein FY528_05310 [Hymenobacter lutimineralis]
MAFSVTEIARLFPSFLTDTEKTRINQGLSQFDASLASSSKLYTDFYTAGSPAYLLQGDLLPSMRLPVWQAQQGTYAKGHTNALLIANTCDVDVVGNPRNVPKEIGFVQLIPLADFLARLERTFQAQQLPLGTIRSKLQNIESELRGQLLTNVFYLPAVPGGLPEQVALLDRPFWFPAAELAQISQVLLSNRLASLSQWGYYLFILKLSYHLCRLPEERDRN